MVSGGTRFTRSERPRPAPRVIDVEARRQHDTLYDVLVVSPKASTREIRKVARALRRNLPDNSALHDVCLAEQVLGRNELRSEYDQLLARLRAAHQPMPKIGTAIEGARLGPPLSARIGEASKAGLTTAGKVLGTLLKISFAIIVLVLIGIAFGTSKSTPRYDIDKIKIDLKPIQLPKFEYRPIDIHQFDVPPPKLDLPKYDSKYLPPDPPPPPLPDR